MCGVDYSLTRNRLATVGYNGRCVVLTLNDAVGVAGAWFIQTGWQCFTWKQNGATSKMQIDLLYVHG